MCISSYVDFSAAKWNLCFVIKKINVQILFVSEEYFGLYKEKIRKERRKMNKFAVGILLGCAVAAAGVEYMGMSKSSKRKVMRKGRMLVDKAEDALEDIGKEMW